MGEQVTSGEARTSASDSTRVLIVDDDTSVRGVTLRLLAGRGLSVVGVSSAEEALRALADPGATFDVVLLDMTMPGLSGRRAVDAIRGVRPGLPIVVMTGYSDLAVAPLLEAGTVAGFIRKPFTAADLVHSLEAALA